MSEAKARFYQGEKGNAPIIDFNQVLPEESHEKKAALLEYHIAKKIGEDLVRTYPNRQWEVNVDTRNECVVLSAPGLNKRMGYRLHMKRDNIAALLPRCRKAAGEILERFGVTRGRIIDPYDIEQMPRDFQDNVNTVDSRDTVEAWNKNRGK
jgi:hypothetical protein